MPFKNKLPFITSFYCATGNVFLPKTMLITAQGKKEIARLVVVEFVLGESVYYSSCIFDSELALMF